MKPLISVIVPVYNVEKYLENCVQSILKQTYTQLEIILVDDGSTDNSGDMCDRYQEEDSRIQVIHKSNGGLSDARNYGKEKATGDFIIFIDSDDYIHVDMIEELYQQIVREAADVSVCGIMNSYSSGMSPQCSNTELYFVCSREEFLREYLIGEKIPGAIGNKLFKIDLVKSIDFPVGKIYEDAFYHFDLVQQIHKVVVSTKPYYYYVHREGSITTKPFAKRDMVYIDIYEDFYNYVIQHGLPLETEAFFRLSYAHFFILDKMLHMEDYQSIEDYPQVVNYLKKNALKIAGNPIFRRGRRFSALALKVHVALYRRLMLANEGKNMKIHE